MGWGLGAGWLGRSGTTSRVVRTDYCNRSLSSVAKPDRSEDPRPSVHLERPRDAADGRHAQSVMPTDGSRVRQPEICSSAGLHHVYAVRRHRFSREAHRDKVWTSAGRVETQLSRSTRQNTSVPCCCRFGSIRFEDVGHVVTGCTVVVDSPQQHHDGKLLGRIWCAPAAAPSLWVMRR